MVSVRSALFDSLKKDLLGPRNGTFEELEKNPRGEYQVGVLEPSHFVRGALEYYRPVDLRIGDDEIREDDDVADNDADNLSLTLDLDPRALPKSIGLSFIISSTKSPFINILVTWARYTKLEKRKWKRAPNFLLLKNVDVREKMRWEKEGLRVELRTSSTENQNYYVSLYLINDTPLENPTYAKTEDLIFQPQIRVNCGKGAHLVSVRGEKQDEEEQKDLSLLYADRPTLARGHMCSAVWKEVDPERPFSNSTDETSSDLENPFISIEKELLTEENEEYFINPDVRTEFIPCYSIPQVNYESKEDYGRIPEINAEQLSEVWDSRILDKMFDPLVTAYANWILEQEKIAQTFFQPQQKIVLGLIERCKESLKRIKEGLNLLKVNDDLRLSFCFMNKVMDTQSRWKRDEPLHWRLFQIAFILQNILSIAQEDHPDRNVCDVLWFPTGGGKTEAYLGLLVLTLAFRRRMGSKAIHQGAGTAVISRYTLRMLTIQQFRRALIAIVACDYYRIKNWKPQNCPLDDKTIWGTSRFSIGLWVGGAVTPNHLLAHKRFNRWAYKFEYFLGALGRLRGYDVFRERGYRVVRTEENEPAQIMNCPVCKSILAVPNKRILQSEKFKIHWIIYSPSKPNIASNFSGLGFKTSRIKITSLPNPKYFVLTVEFSTSSPIGARDVDNWWTKIIKPKLGPNVKQAFARASRPGYFIKKWGVTKEDIDFEIHCPDASCQLNSSTWTELIRGYEGKEVVTEPLEPFSIPEKKGVAFSFPISAFVIDDQIYHRCPSVIVATVDKFARLPFEPRAGSIFGNVNKFDSCWGYYRSTVPPDRGGLQEGDIITVPRFEPPQLIIQDELHLIEGPLGSMVGLYETAIEELASQMVNGSSSRPKYIASSATIQHAEPHIRAVFDRKISIFPSPGISIEDNFFSHTKEAHPIDSNPPGRLYVGVCAPGRGPHTPTIRIWSSILQKVFELRNIRGDDEEVDQFWTLIGYFNALRELASASTLYKIDIVERLRQTNTSPRPLEPSMELSSQMDSSKIPMALNQLSKPLPENIIDAVLATSMFGTGVDVDRLGLMVVHGQPKTTSNYIQATGRVGRKNGGLVVTFYRSTRPRDLDHYEFFIGYHRCLHKYVEPISANPFSPRARDRALVPIMVSLLRNAKIIDGVDVNPDWPFEEVYTGSTKKIPISGSRIIKQFRKSKEVCKLIEVLEQRSQNQPLGRKPKNGTTEEEAEAFLDRWKAHADSFSNLLYSETTMTKEPQYPVVLGDSQHKTHDLPMVVENTPQSLRDEKMHRGVAIRPSQFVFNYGVGSIVEAPNGPRMILDFRNWGGLFRSPNLHMHLSNNYEIPEANLSALLGNGRIFRLPTNADLLERDETPIFRTGLFPKWAHCQDHNTVYRLRPDGRTRCPQCDSNRYTQDQAMRFVMACRQGHLDDVKWNKIVHQDGRDCDNELFRWIESGSTLSDIKVRCEKCGAEVTLSQVYYGRYPCSGLLPESGEVEHCNERASVVLRNASNLRVSVLESVLTIPPRDTNLGRILENPYLHSILSLALQLSWNKEQIIENLEKIQNTIPGLNQTTIKEIEEIEDNLLIKTIKDVVSGKQPKTKLSTIEIRDAELEALQDAALLGHPPEPDKNFHDFEVDKDSVKTFALSKNIKLRITPINRLRVVIGQKGYKRVIGEGPHRTRETFLKIGKERWYLGVALRGEGIFIDIPPGEQLQLDKETKNWASEFKRRKDLNYHPVFVWWHTLSHRIIKALALDSGYSSASIRERLYIRYDDLTKSVEGAILLFTSQRGGDGTLGGLIALVPEFHRVLSSALRNIDSCSNDPLCSEQRVSPKRRNGAACYACLFTSETSCEFGNSYLDRNLLGRNLP